MPEKCPIPNAHRRLEQAHRLWHQTLGSYADPDGFQTNLNALIEALRNVTFMLQSEKENIPGFDDWYEKARAAMKSDPVMSWLNGARTTVVHKADLEIVSTAHVSVHNNLTLVAFSTDVPPLVPNLVVCSLFAAQLPEPFASNRRDLVLAIERRWCVADLPNWELLDALAYAYGFLSDLVIAAHERSGHSMEVRDHSGVVHRAPGGRMPCMITSAEVRTARVALEDNRPLISKESLVELTHDDIPALIARYGAPPELSMGDDPFKFAESLVPMAKNVLQKDGYHIRLFHIRTPNGWQPRSFVAGDRAEKYALTRRLANEAQSLQGDAIVEIAEAWWTPVRDWKPDINPSELPNRLEILTVAVATAQGEFRSYDTPFTRDDSGAIVFGETQVQDSPMPAYLAPFCEIWGLPAPPVAEHREIGTD